MFRRPQQRAVTADRQHDLDRPGGGVGRVEHRQVQFTALAGQGDQFDARLGQPGGRGAGGDRDVRPAGVGDQQHPAVASSARLLDGSAIDCRRGSRGRVVGRGVLSQVHEELHIAARSGQRGGDHAGHAPPQ